MSSSNCHMKKEEEEADDENTHLMLSSLQEWSQEASDLKQETDEAGEASAATESYAEVGRTNGTYIILSPRHFIDYIQPQRQNGNQISSR